MTSLSVLREVNWPDNLDRNRANIVKLKPMKNDSLSVDNYNSVICIFEDECLNDSIRLKTTANYIFEVAMSFLKLDEDFFLSRCDNCDCLQINVSSKELHNPKLPEKSCSIN